MYSEYLKHIYEWETEYEADIYNAYIQKFGRITFSTVHMNTEEFIRVAEEALMRGEPTTDRDLGVAPGDLI